MAQSKAKGRVSLTREVSSIWSLKLLYLRLVYIFKKAFLPNGYPHTVSSDYLEYQVWDSLQAFASSIMNNLATQAVFKGVGVGDATATALAATITWILKDGTSIIGSLIFATVQSTRMDSYCKRWRLFADLVNDLAICIDLISPALGRPYFAISQCFSGILRSLVGIAGGATRAALTQHQAKCNNLADVSAKDNSQERMVNLFAMVFSLVLIPFVSEQTSLIWTLFTIFTILHIYSNYRAIKSVRIDVFNANRLANFLERFVGARKLSRNESSAKLSVESINLEENVWFFASSWDRLDRCFEGVQICYAAKPTDDSLTSAGATFDPEERFMISSTPTGTFEVTLFQDLSDGRVHLQRSSPDNSRLLIEALFVVFLIKKSQNEVNGPIGVKCQIGIKGKKDVKGEAEVKQAFDYVATNRAALFEAMEANGWNLGHLLLFELFKDYEVPEEGVEDDSGDLKKIQ